MRNGNLACVFALLALLAVVGCQQNERPGSAAVEPPAAIEPTVEPPTFTTLTLSAEQLMSLDWNGRGPGRPTIEDKRIVGAGVEFDIHFPGGAGVSPMDYTSSMGAGQGVLAGGDVSGYQALALKFTLVSIKGGADPNFPVEVAAGAIIGPAGGRLSACEPVTLGLSPDNATKVGVTSMRTDKVRVIGFHAHLTNPLAWDSHGGVVTLRVEPAADAQVLPSPTPAVDPKSGKTSSSAEKPRTKSPSSPAIGTTHVGAW